MTAPLPRELKYLEPVLEEMRKIPPEELDESIDTRGLEAALRERVKSHGRRGAAKLLAADRDALEKWLAESGEEDAAAAWVIGYLMRPGALARWLLLAPADIMPPSPTIIFETPVGWSVEHSPFWLHVSKGDVTAHIGAIDKRSLEMMRAQNEMREQMMEHPPVIYPEGFDGRWTRSAAQFGECHGDKYTFSQTTPAFWKAVQYLLEVPGGAIHCAIDGGGTDFNKSALEERLHTLQVVQP